MVKKNKKNKNTVIKLERILERRGLLKKENILKNVLTNEKTLGISRVVLISLLATGVVTLAVMAPGSPLIFRPFLGPKSRRKNIKKDMAKTKNALYDLKSRRLITMDYTNEGWVIRLTERGREKALKFYLKAFSFKHKKWDGKWRVVIFDVPVWMNRKRDALREFLKHAGFREIQKSVYVFPYPCWEELNALLEYLQLEPYVRYFEATFLNQAETLRKIFRV